jgi:hypothetical protein
MSNRRARAAAIATVLGLGALGGVALGTNPGAPPSSGQAGAGSEAVVTAPSGTAATVAQPAAAGNGPIVTRVSGAGIGSEPVDD